MADVVIAINAIDNATRVLEQVANTVGALPQRSGLEKWATVISGVRDGLHLFGRAASIATGFVRPLVQEAQKLDQLADIAAGLGEHVADVQAFAFAMEEAAGVDLSSSVAALQRLRVVIADINSGGNMQGKSIFAQLGLDASQMVGKSPIAQFIELRDALAKIQNPSQRALFAQDILGKGGINLSPALIGEQFAESMEKFRQLHGGATESTVAAIGAMNDAIGRMAVAFDGIQTKLLEEFAPVISEFASWLEDTLTDLSEISFEPLIQGINEASAFLAWFGGFFKRGGSFAEADEAFLQALARLGMTPGMVLPTEAEVEAAGRRYDPGYKGPVAPVTPADAPDFNALPGIIAKLEASIRAQGMGAKFAEYDAMIRAAGSDEVAQDRIKGLIKQDIIGGLISELSPRAGGDPIERQRQETLKVLGLEEQTYTQEMFNKDIEKERQRYITDWIDNDVKIGRSPEEAKRAAEQHYRNNAEWLQDRLDEYAETNLPKVGDKIKDPAREKQAAELNQFFDAMQARRGAIIANATPDLQAVESRLLTRGRARQPVEELVIYFSQYLNQWVVATKEQIELQKQANKELHKQTEEEKKKFGVKIIE